MIDVENLRKIGKQGIEVLVDYMIHNHIADEKILEKILKANRGEIISNNYPYSNKMRREEYEEEKRKLQIEMVKFQNHVKKHKLKYVFLFEGRDAAGKGGTIKRITEHLNPRGARVVALLKPTEKEAGQWYFQRYIEKLPTDGEIVFFDRSWYNRTGVEKVMNFCSETQYLEFVNQAPNFENMIIRSGIHLNKFWFSVSREEQLRRFIARICDPLKQWKLSPMDIQSIKRWEDYTRAKESMFFFTDTKESPWVVIRSDDKKRARINVMKYILTHLDYDEKNVDAIGEIDPHILGSASDIYEEDELIQRELFIQERTV